MNECKTLILGDEDMIDDSRVSQNLFDFDNFRCSLQTFALQNIIIYHGKAGTKMLKNRYGECS